MFNGYNEAEKVNNSSKNMSYINVKTPVELYDILLECWSEDTCAPRLRNKWTKDNPTLGQCSITAFVVQDIFGGKVYGINTESGIHCYNVVDGYMFDLTSEQFGDRAADLIYNPSTDKIQNRTDDHHFKKEEKFKRYQTLIQKIQAR